MATKSDLREIQTTLVISSLEGKLKARNIGALKHFECSSLHDYRVIGILGAALKAVQFAETTERREKTMKCDLQWLIWKNKIFEISNFLWQI